MNQQYPRRVLAGLLLVGAGCTPDVGDTGDGGDGGDDVDDGANTSTSDGGELELDHTRRWVGLDQVPVPGPAQGRWPAAAFGEGQYLVVWEDHRARRPILYGGRVTADGAALDSWGFPILDGVPGAELLGEYEPAVASEGTDFLVVTEMEGQILGVRVNAAGEVLDPDAIVIAAQASAASRPSLSFDGEHYRVAWFADGIYQARVDPDGTVLDPGGVLAYASNVETRVGVSFDGTNHLLSWADYDAQLQTPVLNGGRLAPDGTRIDETPFRIHTIDTMWTSLPDRLVPVAGFDGTNHVIAWTEDLDGSQVRVLVSRVTPQGVVLDPDGILVDTDSSDSLSSPRVDIASADGRSDVVWGLSFNGEGGVGVVRVAQIETDGTTHPFHEFSYEWEATLASHPDGALLVRRVGEDRDTDYPAIVGVKLSATGSIVADSEVAPASPANRQAMQAVASDGHIFFALWTDTRDPTGEGKALYGIRVGADGQPLDPVPIQFDDGPADVAHVVFDGANFVVSWVHFTGGEGDGSPLNTVRVSPAGERLDIEPLHPPLNSPSFALTGASDGTHTLLIGSVGQTDIEAVLMDQAGTTGTVIPILDNQGYSPAVAFDGFGYLVAWFNPGFEVVGQRISNTGTLEGPRFSIATSLEPVRHVAIAGGAGNHVVVWQNGSGIWATRVSSDGQVLDPGGHLVVASEPAFGNGGCDEPERTTGSCASVVFDGEDFILAWRQPSIPGDVNSLDLYAATLSPNGELVGQFVISHEPEREGPPFLAVGDGAVLAAYGQFVPGPPYDTRRAVARLLP